MEHAAQTCTVCGTILAKATGHSFGAWTTAAVATVFAAEQQTRTCTKCEAQETRSTGTKLTATISVNVKGALPLKMKQKLKKVRVTGLANGDSVKSWKSSNTKIVKVTGKKNGTCTITAQKKTGQVTVRFKKILEEICESGCFFLLNRVYCE